MQIGDLTLAGLRELAEEAGEKRKPATTAVDSAQLAGEKASELQGGEQPEEEQPAVAKRPSTPPPAEGSKLEGPGTPEKPGSPSLAGPPTPSFTPPQVLKERARVRVVGAVPS